MKSSNSEILEVEAIEVSNNPLEATIEKELVKNNVTDAVINSLVAKYGSMKLRSIDDKENYLEIKEARKDVRKVGILAERICKAGREDAVRVQKLWLSKEKEVLNKIGVVQDKLDAEIKSFDDEVQRKEDVEKKRQEEAFIKRQSELLKYGARYENGSYVLNHISYEAINIQEADEEIYNDVILPKYKKQFEANESEKVAEENKRQAEALKLKQEQEELQKQQAEFRQQQEAFNKQKADADRQRLESERKEQQRLSEEKKVKDEAENKLFRNRLAQLNEAGWNGKFAFRGDENNPIMTYESIIELDDEAFGIIRDLHNKIVSEQKEIQLQKIKEEAVEKERLRIEEQQKQLQLKKEQEEKQRLEDVAKASDKQKWSYLLESINEISVPAFNSNIYKGKLASFKSLVEQIKAL